MNISEILMVVIFFIKYQYFISIYYIPILSSRYFLKFTAMLSVLVGIRSPSCLHLFSDSFQFVCSSLKSLKHLYELFSLKKSSGHSVDRVKIIVCNSNYISKLRFHFPLQVEQFLHLHLTNKYISISLYLSLFSIPYPYLQQKGACVLKCCGTGPMNEIYSETR